jgi:DNA ligase (NAD+)
MRYLLDNKKVSDFASLYDLKKEDVIGVYFSVDGKKVSIQDKSADNIINAIEESKKVPFERVLYALGIRYVGEVGAKTLAYHFEDIDNLIAASIEDLLNVEDIGQTIAESVYSWFKNEENIREIQDLRQKDLKFVVEKQDFSTKLQGKSFVVSGTFETFSRDGIKKTIEQNGGKNVSSLSKKTDYLVCGEKMGPEKKRKAESLNIPMITEQEFLEMLK